MFPGGRDQRLRRHLDPQVDDVEPVVAEDDLDEVLADVVDVTLHSGEEDLPLRGARGFLHELLQVGDPGFHHLGRLQHLGHDQFVVAEEPANLVHASHQGAVDDLQRRRALGALGLEIGDQPLLCSLHDVAREPLVQWESVHLDALLRLLLAVVGGERRDIVV